jgi:hypothetical protein
MGSLDFYPTYRLPVALTLEAIFLFTTDLGPLSLPPQLVGILLQLTYLFLVV